MTEAIFVSGGSRGIGAAIVEEAARQGYDVAFTYLGSEEKAAEVAKNASAAGDRRVRHYRMDVRDSANVDAVAERVLDDFGGIRAVVANAGVSVNGLLYSLDDDQWRLAIDTNLTGTFFLCRAFLPELVAQRAGRILMMSSIVAAGSTGQCAYAASKAGLEGLARSIAKEYGRKGITANVIVPGYFETDMTRETLGEGHKTYADRFCPVGRPGALSELAQVVVFFCGDAVSYVNGAAIPVTGGLDWAP